MSDMNTVVMTGRFVADPEVVSAGKANILKYRVATSHYDGKEKKEVVDFWNVVRVSSNSSEDYVTKFVTTHGAKGKSIVFRGNLVQNVWTDKDGKDHRDAQINLSEVSNIFSPEKVNSKVPQPQPVQAQAQPVQAQAQPVQAQAQPVQEQYIPVQTPNGVVYVPASQVQGNATQPQAQPVQAQPQPVQVTPPTGEGDFFSADPNIVNGYC
jgi:single-stranded DNA-binding protein